MEEERGRGKGEEGVKEGKGGKGGKGEKGEKGEKKGKGGKGEKKGKGVTVPEAKGLRLDYIPEENAVKHAFSASPSPVESGLPQVTLATGARRGDLEGLGVEACAVKTDVSAMDKQHMRLAAAAAGATVLPYPDQEDAIKYGLGAAAAHEADEDAAGDENELVLAVKNTALGPDAVLSVYTAIADPPPRRVFCAVTDVCRELRKQGLLAQSQQKTVRLARRYVDEGAVQARDVVGKSWARSRMVRRGMFFLPTGALGELMTRRRIYKARGGVDPLAPRPRRSRAATAGAKRKKARRLLGVSPAAASAAAKAAAAAALAGGSAAAGPARRGHAVLRPGVPPPSPYSMAGGGGPLGSAPSAPYAGASLSAAVYAAESQFRAAHVLGKRRYPSPPVPMPALGPEKEVPAAVAATVVASRGGGGGARKKKSKKKKKARVSTNAASAPGTAGGHS